MRSGWRDRILQALVEGLAAETGGSKPEVTIHVCGVQCNHIWDGPLVEFDGGRGTTSTCSICGAWAINVSMMEGA